jgi:hypothetical protein
MLKEERRVEKEEKKRAEVMMNGVEVLLTTKEMIETDMISIKQTRGNSVMKLQQNASSYSTTKY